MTFRKLKPPGISASGGFLQYLTLLNFITKVIPAPCLTGTLGLLAYWLVNTVRHQLKKNEIHNGLREIVRIMNTQKVVTSLVQNVRNEVISIRRCSEPNQHVREIYDILKHKYAPFVKKKFIVHKSEPENYQTIERQLSLSG